MGAGDGATIGQGCGDGIADRTPVGVGGIYVDLVTLTASISNDSVTDGGID